MASDILACIFASDPLKCIFVSNQIRLKCVPNCFIDINFTLTETMMDKLPDTIWRHLASMRYTIYTD